MTSKTDQFKQLKATANKILKETNELKTLISHFNEGNPVVLSIQTMADIGKITSGISSLHTETESFLHAQLRSLKKEPDQLADKLLAIRHKMRMLVGIVKGYSEMVIEDLSSDKRLKPLIEQFVRMLEISKQLVILIDDMRDSSGQSIEKVNKVIGQEKLAVKKSMSSKEGNEKYPIATQEKNSILIVDDSEANCELLNNWLQRKHYHTYIARSGKQALAMLEEHADIDIVLLDVMMPFMDGHEVLLRIKKNKLLADTMVIMISGMDEIDTVVRCIMSGAEDYLTKPFNPYLLAARIYACFERKRLHRIEKAYLEYLAYLPYLMKK